MEERNVYAIWMVLNLTVCLRLRRVLLRRRCCGVWCSCLAPWGCLGWLSGILRKRIYMRRGLIILIIRLMPFGCRCRLWRPSGMGRFTPLRILGDCLPSFLRLSGFLSIRCSQSLRLRLPSCRRSRVTVMTRSSGLGMWRRSSDPTRPFLFSIG